MSISRWVARLPIVQKLRLIITLACAIMIALVCVAFGAYDMAANRQDTARNVSVRARMFAVNISASVAFQNVTDASELLRSLQTDSDSDSAIIFDRNGKVFAVYPQGNPLKSPAVPSVADVVYTFDHDFLHVWAPITQSDQRLGTLYIRQSLARLDARFKQFVALSTAFLLVTGLIAFFLSNQLQRLVSAPILALALTARTVAQNKNYTIQATKMAEDEIGTLTDDFNAMLGQIQQRETSLEVSQQRLTSIIESSLEGIFTVDSSGTILDINTAAEGILGLSRAMARGRDCEELLVPDRLKSDHPLNLLLEQPQAGNLIGRRVEALLQNARGTEFSVEMAIAKIMQGEALLSILFIRDITDRKRAETEQRRASDRLTALNRLDRTISSNLELGQLFAAFARETSALIRFEVAEFITVNPEANEWGVTHSWMRHLRESGTAVRQKVSLADSGVAWVAQQKRPLLENQINPAWSEASQYRQAGLRARAIFPLVLNDQTIGVLSLTSPEANVFDRDAAEFLQAVADQLTLAVQNARLYDEIRRHAAELGKRVEERTEQLVSANKELEAFSYSVSHDLRAPLRAIAGFARILTDEHCEGQPTDMVRYLGLIQENAQRMGQLIDDLLSFSRLSKQSLKRIPFDLVRLSQDVYHSLGDEHADRAIRFNVSPLPEVSGDPVLMRQVLINLISNALKYSRPRDPAVIEIGCRTEGDGRETVFYVRDNGVGFDMQHAGKLFGVFQRLHRADEFEGTGVGLAIVHRIIQRHGGRVWAESTAGAGATFFFTIPEGPNHEQNI